MKCFLKVLYMNRATLMQDTIGVRKLFIGLSVT